jgi:uncharacterized Zn-binding protein involved in type VI secretion
MPPAARVGDAHTCPIHGGGPVLPPCSISVIIGGMPAARVGDLALCAPPDAIAVGSTTVLINGMPAARMGDATAHGGVVASGCPTVIIGG